jgi:tripartite-type tricarboxylate transporter receptor subunit TctC
VRSWLTTAAALGLTVGLGLGSASAQDYPTSTITIVVSFSAGGPTDTVTRLVAEPMSRTLGQQMIVENVTGAGGTLSASRVARRSPTATRFSGTTSVWRRAARSRAERSPR